MMYTNPPLAGQDRQAACGSEAWVDAAQVAAENGLIPIEIAQRLQVEYALGDLTPTSASDALRNALASGNSADKALDAIARAFDPADVIELRACDPAVGGCLSCCGRPGDPEERATLVDFIRRQNGHRNLYFGINPRRVDMAGTTQSASAADVVARRMVVLDFDMKDAQPNDPDWSSTLSLLREKANPLAVLNSGNGFHVWLPITPVFGAEVSAATPALAETMAEIGADNMADPPRIARVPYTVNLPTAAKSARGAVVKVVVPC
jgi:hypothetical protein